MTNQLTPKDIWPNPVYEAARHELRAKVIALKEIRRVKLTGEVTLVFENRETLRFQVQEMLRAEGISSPAGIQEQLEVYNEMMPGEDHLQATLFIEVTDEARIPEVLHRLVGLEESLSLRFGAHAVRASFETGRTDGQRVSAVQYVQFKLEGGVRADFLGASEAQLALDHPGAKASVTLSTATLSSLKSDLATS